MNHIAGIDYGSKLAGTTVISWINENNIYQIQSDKKQDADKFIKDFIDSNEISTLYIDAPLSLPKAYQNSNKINADFFYRVCDKECQAMSPMFLGGLTARAMKLKYQLRSITIHETYPAQLIKTLDLSNIKKDNVQLEIYIRSVLSEFKIDLSINNRHQIDSLLALYSGLRHQIGNHIEFGDPDEGLIII